jgi:hypothetical membrane protein
MSESRSIQTCLVFAVGLPIVYFGAQLAAAPFYPNYSFNHLVASWLGSGNSTRPWIFNVGLLLTGVTGVVGSYGLFRAFRQSAGLVLGLLVGIAVLVIGVTTFKSGVYPLPDPRHNSWGFLTLFIIIAPLLLLIASWRAHLSPILRYYIMCSVALVVVLVPFMSGMVSVSWVGKGTLQRLFAIATFVPIGCTAYSLLTRRNGAVRSEHRS